MSSSHTKPPYFLLDTNWKGEDRGHDWYISGGRYEDDEGVTQTAVCIVTGNATSFPACRETAEFIVRACNNHDALLDALAALEGAVDPFLASQDGATDPRCGLVQPVTVAECEALNQACANARAALAKATP